MAWRSAAIAAAVACLAASASAIAQPLEAAEPGDGNALFQRGLEDMLAGRYADGCPTLAASYRAEPLPGVLFTLAECHAKAGHPATAIGLYRDYLGRVEAMAQPLKDRHAERALIAARQLGALAGQVARLTLALPEGAPETAVVRRDGLVVPAALMGRALPADPGAHELSLELEDGSIARLTVLLDPGEEETATLRLPSALAPPPADDWHGGVAAAAGGVALASLVVGAVSGGLAVDRAAVVDEHCDGTRCDPDGLAAAEAGEVLGTTSTVGLAVAGGAAAVALIVWLTAPEAPREVGRLELRW